MCSSAAPAIAPCVTRVNGMELLARVCRWLPYALLAALVALFVLDVPVPAWLIAAALLACLLLLAILSWSGRSRSADGGAAGRFR